MEARDGGSVEMGRRGRKEDLVDWKPGERVNKGVEMDKGKGGEETRGRE